MSNDFSPFGSQPPNPFSSQTPNPYASPMHTEPEPRPPGSSPGKVIAPGIGLVVVGTLGLATSIFNVCFAIFANPVIDPNAPPFLQEMQRGSTGMVTIVIQSVFIVLNLFIIFGGVQMMRLATWGLALAASIAAMANFGSCCCLAGIPVGVWSVVILSQDDVRQMFKLRAQ